MMLETFQDVNHKKTLIVGATSNPERYACKAIKMLRLHKHPVLAFGLKNGVVEDINFITSFPTKEDEIDTVTMYVGEKNQEKLYLPIIALNPKRIIFNPGTENHEFYSLLKKHDIYFEEACTLVKLSIGDY